MRAITCVFAFLLLPACQGQTPAAVDTGAEPLSLEDELGFRQLREDFHAATMTGDTQRMRDLWTDDAVLTTGTGEVLVGGDAIAAYLSSNPDFG
ncbi:MAG: nuclear transport factor 2 family protein, partial [Planctomycetota bacterium]|nr:nuclear transport factor 2 family protein [Planctomycetota bacterium]